MLVALIAASLELIFIRPGVELNIFLFHLGRLCFTHLAILLRLLLTKSYMCLHVPTGAAIWLTGAWEQADFRKLVADASE